MRITTPPLFGPIPATRKVRADTDLHQFLAKDRKTFETEGQKWVQQTGPEVTRQVIAAGNPNTYSVEVDGHGSKGWRPGAFSQATRSVRVQFIGRELADLCNDMRPMLLEIIKQDFRRSKRLARNWSWWIIRNGLNKKGGKPQVLGLRVPQSTGIYDVLFLAPFGDPVEYAWFANRNATTMSVNRIKFEKRFKVKKRGRALSVYKRGKGRLSGFMGRAAQKIRRKLGTNEPIRVRAVFVRTGMQAERRRNKKEGTGMPVLVVSFKPLSIGIEA